MSNDAQDDARMTVVVRGINKSFGDTRGQTRAADDVTFSIAPGECVGLVGESGSGKSTIARIMVGLETADSGTVEFPTVDTAVGRRRVRRLARARAAQIVFQNPFESLDRRLTVQEALSGAMRLHGATRADAKARVPRLLEQVRLSADLAGRRPHQLSGGERQRVAIARALSSDPTLLILDEAVSALDVSVQAKVIELMNDIRRDTGISMLFVSHDLSVVGAATQRTLVLYQGRVVERGKTEDVLCDPKHPYTRLLVASSPHERWDPSEVLTRRTEFEQSLH